MKKNMIFSGAMSMMTALLLCTACSSDDVATDKAAVAVPEGKVIHYTATAGEGDETRATLNGEKKYEFQEGDKLVITGTDISGELTLTGTPGTTATFEGDLTYTGSGTPADNLELKAVLVSESNAMTKLEYDEATYPTTAIASTLADAVQKYSHFTATSTYADKDFKVSQQTSFLNFTVTFTDGTAANTDFNITIKNGGSTVRTGSVKTAEVDSKVVAQFVAAMPKGTTMSSATVQLGTKSAIAFGGTTTLDANKIYNIKKTVAPSVPENAISGKFSVSATKKVYFSKGNLQYDGTNWKFAEQQYDYIETATGYPMDHFTWGNTSNSTAWNGTSYYTENADLSGTYDWGSNAISNGGNTANSGWYTLSRDEWKYVFGANIGGSKRSGATVGVDSNIYYAAATINTDGTAVNGMILFPDGATFAADDATWGTMNAGGTKCTTAQWTALEAKGCVFLPAAGRRSGTSMENVGSIGYYWSSTAHVTGYAFYVYFYSNGVTPPDYDVRSCGFSVRLVRPVE